MKSKGVLDRHKALSRFAERTRDFLYITITPSGILWPALIYRLYGFLLLDKHDLAIICEVKGCVPLPEILADFVFGL
jgi:hypothetical protein